MLLDADEKVKGYCGEMHGNAAHVTHDSNTKWLDVWRKTTPFNYRAECDEL